MDIGCQPHYNDQCKLNNDGTTSNVAIERLNCRLQYVYKLQSQYCECEGHRNHITL